MAARLNSRLMNSLVQVWLPVILWMGLIFYFSSLSGSKIPPLFPLQDVIFHFLVYLALGYFFARAFKDTFPKVIFFKVILITTLFGLAYGASDEFHQLLVPYRTASVSDVFIDVVGTFTGGVFYLWRK